ncbi:hypothetical protein HPB51_025054 [Rhipicephalus microplus]|uniref:FP protein C-terminal domain-containing protein n=1 Tax=Rhipicephalus microplus TaxID=6941 RepID=A0A9J6E5E5_RHIMP|nr:hypothetical protein HPB51_025054 [Rhipicephalus microplus]
MGERNASGLQDVTKALAEKQANSIKEVVKVLGDLLAKLDVFSSDVKNEVAKVATSKAEIRTELGDIHKSMKFMNDCFENFKKDVDGFRREIAEVKTRNAECCKQNQELRKELAVAGEELVDLKQYSRNMNVEIQGLPVAPNEDLETVVEDIAKSLEVEVSKDDTDVTHRVPTKKKDLCNVIVKFRTRRARDSLLEATRKKKLQTGLLGFDRDLPLYLNEHLCVENKILLGKARQAKRDKDWKFVWVSQGRILMRKAEKSPVLHITCDADLVKVV